MSVVSLEDVLKEWETDAKMEMDEPAIEQSRIGRLHAKYLRYMSQHNLLAISTQKEYEKMYSLKWEWYSGNLNNKEDVAEHGLGLCQNVAHTTESKRRRVDGDVELTKLLLKKAVHDQIHTACQAIVKELSNRTWQINGIINWNRYIGGGFSLGGQDQKSNA